MNEQKFVYVTFTLLEGNHIWTFIDSLHISLKEEERLSSIWINASLKIIEKC